MTSNTTHDGGATFDDGAGYAQPQPPRPAEAAQLDANTLLEIIARQRNEAADRAATLEAVAIGLKRKVAELQAALAAKQS